MQQSADVKVCVEVGNTWLMFNSIQQSADVKVCVEVGNTRIICI